MTPEQKEALAAVAGRNLSDDEVAAIEPHLALRDDVAIAKLLSAGRVRSRSVEVGHGTIIAVMSPRGGAFLRALENLAKINDDVYYGMRSVERGVFNPGLPEGRAQLEALKALLNNEFDTELDKMKALGTEPDLIDFNSVSNALNRAEGRLTL